MVEWGEGGVAYSHLSVDFALNCSSKAEITRGSLIDVI